MFWIAAALLVCLGAVASGKRSLIGFALVVTLVVMTARTNGLIV